MKELVRMPKYVPCPYCEKEAKLADDGPDERGDRYYFCDSCRTGHLLSAKKVR
jgi:transposase-like protein